MNKQEAIEIVESRAFNIGDIDLACGLSYTKHIINQIDEPQKVTIPKFVAEYIEKCKRCNLNLEMTLYKLDDDAKVGNWAYGENNDLISEKIDMIARAWLDGYETEKEKLYTVEIPNPNLNAHVVLQKTGDGLVLVTVGNAGWAEWESSKLTEAEIKQDFEWAWDAGFAKEVE